jgi:hypothetical protein
MSDRTPVALRVEGFCGEMSGVRVASRVRTILVRAAHDLEDEEGRHLDRVGLCAREHVSRLLGSDALDPKLMRRQGESFGISEDRVRVRARPGQQCFPPARADVLGNADETGGGSTPRDLRAGRSDSGGAGSSSDTQECRLMHLRHYRLLERHKREIKALEQLQTELAATGLDASADLMARLQPTSAKIGVVKHQGHSAARTEKAVRP